MYTNQVLAGHLTLLSITVCRDYEHTLRFKPAFGPHTPQSTKIKVPVRHFSRDELFPKAPSLVPFAPTKMLKNVGKMWGQANNTDRTRAFFDGHTLDFLI